MIKRLFATGLAAAVLFAAAPAAAQISAPKRPAPPKAAPTAFTGCVESQYFDTRSVNMITAGFALVNASGGREIYWFSNTSLMRTTAAPSRPFHTTDSLQKWYPVIDTVAKAAAADRPVEVQTDSDGTTSYTVRVIWNQRCP